MEYVSRLISASGGPFAFLAAASLLGMMATQPIIYGFPIGGKYNKSRKNVNKLHALARIVSILGLFAALLAIIPKAPSNVKMDSILKEYVVEESLKNDQKNILEQPIVSAEELDTTGINSVSNNISVVLEKGKSELSESIEENKNSAVPSTLQTPELKVDLATKVSLDSSILLFFKCYKGRQNRCSFRSGKFYQQADF